MQISDARARPVFEFRNNVNFVGFSFWLLMVFYVYNLLSDTQKWLERIKQMIIAWVSRTFVIFKEYVEFFSKGYFSN